MPQWLRYLGFAALAAFVPALAAHAYDCVVGTHEACLMSRGMLRMYWTVGFVFVGAPIALVATPRAPARHESDDA